jgi:hypothetical protein
MRHRQEVLRRQMRQDQVIRISISAKITFELFSPWIYNNFRKTTMYKKSSDKYVWAKLLYLEV